MSAAVLAAIIAPSILMPTEHLVISWQNKYLVAAIPAFIVAIKTRSLVWTLLAGMLVMALLQLKQKNHIVVLLLFVRPAWAQSNG